MIIKPCDADMAIHRAVEKHQKKHKDTWAFDNKNYISD